MTRASPLPSHDDDLDALTAAFADVINRHRVQTFKYVLHYHVPAYLTLGWDVTRALDGTNHGDYSVLMKWVRDDPPKYPDRDAIELANAAAALGGE